MTAAPHNQLMIGQLLKAPAGRNPDQTIHDGDGKQQTYRQFHARISQLAAALTRLSLGRWATLGVMDWDSPRYLECFLRQAVQARIAAPIAAGEVPKWATPDRICAVTHLPRTSVGKIDKKLIRQMLAKEDIA